MAHELPAQLLPPIVESVPHTAFLYASRGYAFCCVAGGSGRFAAVATRPVVRFSDVGGVQGLGWHPAYNGMVHVGIVGNSDTEGVINVSLVPLQTIVAPRIIGDLYAFMATIPVVASMRQRAKGMGRKQVMASVRRGSVSIGSLSLLSIVTKLAPHILPFSIRLSVAVGGVTLVLPHVRGQYVNGQRVHQALYVDIGKVTVRYGERAERIGDCVRKVCVDVASVSVLCYVMSWLLTQLQLVRYQPGRMRSLSLWDALSFLPVLRLVLLGVSVSRNRGIMFTVCVFVLPSVYVAVR